MLFTTLTLMCITNVWAVSYKLPYPAGITQTVSRTTSHLSPVTPKEKYAIDFGMSVGNRIVASAAGKVTIVKDDSTDDMHACSITYASYANRIVIQHDDGTQTLYLHLEYNSALVKAGDTVSQGQPIGLSGETGYTCGAHLHFQRQENCGGWYCNSVAISFDDVQGGVVYPNNAYKSNNSQTPPLSTTPYFDGAGSLIDPTSTSCTDGCTQDFVQLHSHFDPNTGGNQPSAGFFQVEWAAGKCEAVELAGGWNDNQDKKDQNMLANAFVEVRSWDGYGADSQYYKLSALPAVVPLKSNSKNPWNLVAVKTTAPIGNGQTRTVSATCVANYNDSRVSVESGKPMAFKEDYSWGGNGSIISYSGNQNFKTSDILVLLGDKKTLAAFQVTKSDQCNTVTFESTANFNLSRKLWNQKDWEIEEQPISNGGSIRLRDTGNKVDWWILKIKAPATGKDGYVRATCSK